MQAFFFVRKMRTEYKCRCVSDTLSTDAYGGNQSQRVQQSKITEMVCCKQAILQWVWIAGAFFGGITGMLSVLPALGAP